MTSMTGSKGPTGSFGMQKRTGSKQRDIIPKGYTKGQLQQFTPEQMELFQQMFSNLGPDSYLSRLAGGDEETFNQIEAPAMRQFNELQGGLASRFSGGVGGGSQAQLGNRRSSGFQNTATAASSNFAQDLASQRQQLQQQAIKDLMGLSNELLNQRPVDRALFQKPQKQEKKALGGWGSVAGGVLGGIGGSFVPGIGPVGGAMIGSAALSGM